MQLLNLVVCQLQVLNQRVVYYEEIRLCDEELKQFAKARSRGWRKTQKLLEDRKVAFQKALRTEFTDFHLNQAVINKHMRDLAFIVAKRSHRRD